MTREEQEVYLREAGWVEDCGGLWNGPGMSAGKWLRIDMAVVLQNIKTPPPMSPEIRKLAEEAVAANAKREAGLAAMTPEDRERAINEWAHKLADEVSALND